MTKILVLGGCGRQGKIIAADLAKRYDVHTADISNEPDILMDPFEHFNDVDMSLYDLVVGALPSVEGYHGLQASLAAGTSYVDLSFTDDDFGLLHDDAVKAGVTVLHDCGVAPGLSHLVAGRAIALGADEIYISVGGVAAKARDDYVITWNPEDLLEEYTRPARIVVDGQVVTVPALSGQIEEVIPGIDNAGRLNTFYSDGLRSLLSKAGPVRRMEERTMRWPGHTEKAFPLIYSGDFVAGMRNIYPEGNNDLLAMKIRARWTSRNLESESTLVVYGNQEMSAMARTTALSCSAFAQLVASGKFKKVGVTSPEDVAPDSDCYKFMLDTLAENGVKFETREYAIGEVNGK